MLGFFVRSDIHDRAGELLVLRLIDQGMGDDMKMLDRTVRHLQAMLDIESFPVRCNAVDYSLN